MCEAKSKGIFFFSFKTFQGSEAIWRIYIFFRLCVWCKKSERVKKHGVKKDARIIQSNLQTIVTVYVKAWDSLVWMCLCMHSDRAYNIYSALAYTCCSRSEHTFSSIKYISLYLYVHKHRTVLFQNGANRLTERTCYRFCATNKLDFFIKLILFDFNSTWRRKPYKEKETTKEKVFWKVFL